MAWRSRREDREAAGSTISSTGVEPAILPVTVYKKPATLEVSPGTASLAVDGTATLRAALKDANGHSIHVDQGDGRGGKVVYWETSDSAVATVEGSNTADEGGHNSGASATVTAVGAGTATITGRHGGNRVTGTATVTVTEQQLIVRRGESGRSTVPAVLGRHPDSEEPAGEPLQPSRRPVGLPRPRGKNAERGPAGGN